MYHMYAYNAKSWILFRRISRHSEEILTSPSGALWVKNSTLTSFTLPRRRHLEF